MTGHKGFEKAVSAIRKLRDAKIRVGVAVTPSSYMKDEYIDTRRFCIENKFHKAFSRGFEGLCFL